MISPRRFVASPQIVAGAPQLGKMRQPRPPIHLVGHVAEREREQACNRDSLEPTWCLSGHGSPRLIVFPCTNVSRKLPVATTAIALATASNPKSTKLLMARRLYKGAFMERRRKLSFTLEETEV